MFPTVCPVCGLNQEEKRKICKQCGWDFSVVLGTSEQVSTFFNKRLDEARLNWQGQHSYDPDEKPLLKCDSFETNDEFVERIRSRPWCICIVELIKEKYDIKTGKFPLRLIKLNDWAKSFIPEEERESLTIMLNRDEARTIYEKSKIWPLYAWLVVEDKTVKLKNLELLLGRERMPILINGLTISARNIRNDTIKMLIHMTIGSFLAGALMGLLFD